MHGLIVFVPDDVPCGFTTSKVSIPQFVPALKFGPLPLPKVYFGKLCANIYNCHRFSGPRSHCKNDLFRSCDGGTDIAISIILTNIFPVIQFRKLQESRCISPRFTLSGHLADILLDRPSFRIPWYRR